MRISLNEIFAGEYYDENRLSQTQQRMLACYILCLLYDEVHRARDVKYK